MRTIRHTDITLTIALCLSLALHVFLFVGAAERYVRATRLWLPGFALDQLPVDSIDPALPPTMPLIETIDPMDRLGETDGAGTAIDSSPGLETMIAPKGFQDQPFVSRDPEGPGRVGAEPSESTAPAGEGARAAVSPGDSIATRIGVMDDQRQNPAEPFRVARVQQSAPVEAMADHSPAKPQAAETASRLELDDASEPTMSGDTLARVDAPVGQSSSSIAAPGATAPAADPAPRGESEIDPVSSLDTAGMDLRRGSILARSGRKHRVTRPQFNLAGKADLYAQRTGNLILKLRIDATGNVQHVSIVKSSGSDALDQSCKVAAYEWWFEPRKDSDGSGLAEEFPFVIMF